MEEIRSFAKSSDFIFVLSKLLWKLLKMQDIDIYLPGAQVGGENPIGQEHLFRAVQIPPFKQGCAAHGSNGVVGATVVVEVVVVEVVVVGSMVKKQQKYLLVGHTS